jgi:four helix bundle protein
LGSLAETEYLIEFSKNLGYIKSDISNIEAIIAEIGKLLWSFQKALSKRAEELKT